MRRIPYNPLHHRNYRRFRQALLNYCSTEGPFPDARTLKTPLTASKDGLEGWQSG